MRPLVAKVTLPPGYYLTWGGQFENFIAARQRLMLVAPAR
jgi:heavy metal efflux system protein